MSIMVTGGAGYIGSHVTRLLAMKGQKVVVVDDFSSGVHSRIDGVKAVELDISSASAAEMLEKVIKEEAVESVIHLAAKKQVGQSVQEPEMYFEQNVGGLTHILKAMRAAGVEKLVFSSSAATYGMPECDLVSEDVECKPINPYGETKLIGEWMAANASAAWGLKVTNLRYFNVAGAGWADLADTAILNLIPIAFSALDREDRPVVFGSDYDTPDGTCIRDYVHVMDLAEAHIAALDYLDQANRKHSIFNVGTGKGASVLEVLDEIRKVSGIEFEPEIRSRRIGDPPALRADVSRIKSELGWSAKRDLHEIIASAWAARSQS